MFHFNSGALDGLGLTGGQIDQISIASADREGVDLSDGSEITFFHGQLRFLVPREGQATENEFDISVYKAYDEADRKWHVTSLRMGKECIGPLVPASAAVTRWYFPNDSLYSFSEFVGLMKAMLVLRSMPVRIPPAVGIAAGRMIGYAMSDIVLTADELRGLMGNYLTSRRSPNGTTRFSDWLEENRDSVGASYSSEIERHFRWRRGNHTKGNDDGLSNSA